MSYNDRKRSFSEVDPLPLTGNTGIGSDSIIQVESLGKRYRLGIRKENYATLRDNLSGSITSLRRRLFNKPRRTGGAQEDFWALKNVSFEIKRGERLGVIGRNGAGKSTLLKILSRITEPTAGRVRLRGRVSSLLEVGTGFHPELTGRENIYLNGAILGMTKVEIRKKFDEIVEFAEIEKFIDTPAKKYSSGMYVRLAFAVAAHLEPEILIVDEVLAVGDAQFQKKCLGKMKEVGDHGRTVLFVSHNMAAIQQLTERCLLLHDGRISFDGNTAQAVEKYLEICDMRKSFSCSDLKTEFDDFSVRSFSFAHEDLEKGFNKPLMLILDLGLGKPFQDVTVRLGLKNSLGARIMTIEEMIPHLPAGQTKVILTVSDHRLPPGAYGVVLALFVRRTRIFSHEKAISVLIPADGIDDPTLIRRRDRLGVFLQPAVKVISKP
jgi:lipopolysaccharide transport system ATP-binding protein